MNGQTEKEIASMNEYESLVNTLLLNSQPNIPMDTILNTSNT